MNNTIEKLSNGDFNVIKFDKCVICEVETEEPESKHVDYRMYYVDGAGQLCKECYENLDNKKYIKI